MLDNRVLESFLEQGALISLSRNEVLIGYGALTWLKEPQQIFPLFYFPDFFLKSETPWLQFQHVVTLELDELILFLEKLNVPERSCEQVTWRESNRNIFEKEFQKLQNLFKIQQLEKAVPYVSMEMENPHLFSLLHSLIHALKKVKVNKGMNIYGFWNNLEGMLGVTPELLLSCEKENEWILKTMACAGTVRHLENKEDVVDKVLKEHQIVIEGIYEALKVFGNVVIKETELVDYSLFKHYITKIFVYTEKKEIQIEEIIGALHPTPALGAYPKEEGFKWLKEYNELIKRERYGAPVGCWIGNGQFLSYVAIRNLQWKNKKYFMTSGCGIIKESILEDEWEEIELKFQAIKKSLAL